MTRKNKQQITAKNPRAAGAPKLYEQPIQRLTAYATSAEVARIRAMFNPRQVVEVLLAECDRTPAPTAGEEQGE